MTNPIKVDTSTTPDSIKQMTDAEMDYAVHQVLLAFAASDTGVASVQVNPSPTTGLTSIGTFADTYTDPVGTHPTTTIYTTNYTFYQDLQTATETYIPPVFVDTSTTPDSLKEQNAELNSTIVARALANLVSEGIGAYYLGTTAPAGGTWTAKATIAGNTDTSVSTAVYLWRKTASASTPATVRPLKNDTTTTPDSLKEMSDVELGNLSQRLRNQIVSTSVGKYQLSNTPPTPGTWIAVGSITDIRRNLANQNYTQSFSGNYSGTYLGTFTGNYNQNFSGNYTGTFSGTYLGPTYYSGFAGNPTGVSYVGNYSKAFTGSYTGTFTGNYSQNFSGTYTGTYGIAYSGSTVQSATSTISTLTLYLRTA